MRYFYTGLDFANDFCFISLVTQDLSWKARWWAFSYLAHIYRKVSQHSSSPWMAVACICLGASLTNNSWGGGLSLLLRSSPNIMTFFYSIRMLLFELFNCCLTGFWREVSSHLQRKSCQDDSGLLDLKSRREQNAVVAWMRNLPIGSGIEHSVFSWRCCLGGDGTSGWQQLAEGSPTL